MYTEKTNRKLGKNLHLYQMDMHLIVLDQRPVNSLLFEIVNAVSDATIYLCFTDFSFKAKNYTP